MMVTTVDAMPQGLIIVGMRLNKHNSGVWFAQ